MTIKNGRSSSVAFTLLEVLVASTILSFGILALLQAYSISTRVVSRSLRLDKAASIAQRELVLAEAVPREQLAAKSGVDGKFRWKLILEGKPHNLVMGTVQVRWQEKGKREEFKLSRIFSPQPRPQE